MTGFSLDFDLRRPNTELRGPAGEDVLVRAEQELGLKLPPSYRWWLTHFSDGANFLFANALFLFPLLEPVASFRDSVVGETRSWQDWEECALKDIIVFGMTGVDFETYAFYTGSRTETGEYPVVWITPGSADEDGYLLINSRFDRFLNIQLNSLWTYHTQDVDEDGEILELGLYTKYDPVITPVSDPYRAAVTAEVLIKQAAKLVRTDHE